MSTVTNSPAQQGHFTCHAFFALGKYCKLPVARLGTGKLNVGSNNYSPAMDHPGGSRMMYFEWTHASENIDKH